MGLRWGGWVAVPIYAAVVAVEADGGAEPLSVVGKGARPAGCGRQVSIPRQASPWALGAVLAVRGMRTWKQSLCAVRWFRGGQAPCPAVYTIVLMPVGLALLLVGGGGPGGCPWWCAAWAAWPVWAAGSGGWPWAP